MSFSEDASPDREPGAREPWDIRGSDPAQPRPSESTADTTQAETQPLPKPTMRPDPGLPDPLQGGQPNPVPGPARQPHSARPAHPGPTARPQPSLGQPQIQQAAQTRAQAESLTGPKRRPQQPVQPQPQARQLPPQQETQSRSVAAGQALQQPQVQPMPQGWAGQAEQPPPRGPSRQQPRRRVQPRHLDDAVPPLGVQSRPTGRTRRQQKQNQRDQAREAKWASNRYAVPYPTDGPKITLGILWFVLVVGGALLGLNFDNTAVSSVAVAVVTATVAGLAGLQVGHAWFPKIAAPRTWTAGAAFVAGISGFYGPWGVPIGLVLGLLILTVYVILYRGHRRPPAQLFDVLVRAAIPVGVASASLAALAFRDLPAMIALVLLVSAYEVGDFLVGTGSFNPVEGPMGGLIALGVVAFFLFLIEPDPFSSESIVMFVAVTVICCVAGQYLASALLPRGNAWAPALRRLDSYLLAAPLWLLLLVLLPDAH